jgi:hypothetical protein
MLEPMASKPLRIVVAGALFFLFAVASQLLFFYYRDNFSTHYPAKALSAGMLRQGELPLWNPAAGGGQPLAGNPNTLTFYPDTLLYLPLPPHVAFNLHFLLHLAGGFFAMRALARRETGERGASTAAAALYALSGAAASATAFYNLVTALPLIPLSVLATRSLFDRPSWRSGVLAGGVFGLVALAGEPVTAIATALLALALGARPLRRQTFAAGAIAVGTGVLIASPLLLAWSEIAGEVERGAFRYSAATVLAASLRPMRLLEMVTTPFLGLVTDGGDAAYRVTSAHPWPPLFISLFAGAIALPALLAPRKRNIRLVVALAAVVFVATGRFNPAIVWAVERFEILRVGRYPEKLALHLSFLVALLAARWLANRDETAVRRSVAAASVVLAAGALAALASGRLTPLETTRLLAGLVLSGVVLASGWWSLRSPRARTLLLLLTFLPLGWWFVRALPVDRFARYVERSPVVEQSARMVRVAWLDRAPASAAGAREHYRRKRWGGDPHSGAPGGVAYTGELSPEGMYSYFTRIAAERFAAGDDRAKIAWARLAGAEGVVARSPVASAGVTPAGRWRRGGEEIHLYRIDAPVAYLSVPAGVIGVDSIQEAVAAIEEGSFDPAHSALVSRRRSVPVAPARVVSAARTASRIEFSVVSPAAALVVVNETYFSAWRAEAGGRALMVLPVNVDRIGVIVPPGESRVVLKFGTRRQSIGVAWAVSLLLLAAAGWLALSRSRSSTAAPAR